jgi:hypothetical protein
LAILTESTAFVFKKIANFLPKIAEICDKCIDPVRKQENKDEKLQQNKAFHFLWVL